MDISKLPKLSKSDPPPASQSQSQTKTEGDGVFTIQTTQNTVDYRGAPAPRNTDESPGISADVWFNVIIAIVCLFMGRQFFGYEMAHMAHKPYPTGIQWQGGEKDGQDVEYPDLTGHQMLSDAGVFFFGLTILFEAAVKACYGMGIRLPRIAIYFAMLLTLATVVLNIYASAVIMKEGGLPLVSLLAVAFGGYILSDLYRTLLISRQRKEAASA